MYINKEHRTKVVNHIKSVPQALDDNWNTSAIVPTKTKQPKTTSPKITIICYLPFCLSISGEDNNVKS